MEDTGSYKTNYFVYIIDLFNEDKRTFMNRIEQLELLTQDITKNFLLQMIEEGQDEQLYEVAKKMAIRGKSMKEICDLLDVTEDFVNRLRNDLK